MIQKQNKKESIIYTTQELYRLNSCEQLRYTVFCYTAHHINRYITWHPHTPACDVVLERPLCSHGSLAPVIPSTIVVFHLQQEKDLFPSQTLFPCKHFAGMCVHVSMCVRSISVVQSWSLVVLLCLKLQVEINGLFFGKKYIEGSLCVCVFVLFKHRCSLSYFQCYFCPVGDDYKRGGESVGAQSKKMRVLICEQH